MNWKIIRKNYFMLIKNLFILNTSYFLTKIDIHILTVRN
jgi:hypothetical protein